MQKLIEKAEVLIEALPFIQKFRNEIIVVKFGGSAMEEKVNADGVLEDVIFMECVGMLPVIVHGGGKAISRSMKKKGIEARFVKGLRVTCEKTIEVVQDVMNNEINPGLVKTIEQFGGRAKGVRGEDVFVVMPKDEVDAATGEKLDLGYVGEPVGVDTGPIRELLDEKIIPVVTPLGRGPDGKVYNVNADSAAALMAKALKARKLAFLSDVPGLLRDRSDPASIMSTLKVGEVEELIKRGVIDGGMLPKVQGGTDALHAGVKKVHMIDGRMQHSLLLEIFTNKGVGTEIIPDEQE